MPLDTRLVALTQAIAADVKSLFQGKQDKLVSGHSIKTVGGQSLLGEGDLELPSANSNIDCGNASTLYGAGDIQVDCGGA